MTTSAPTSASTTTAPNSNKSINSHNNNNNSSNNTTSSLNSNKIAAANTSSSSPTIAVAAIGATATSPTTTTTGSSSGIIATNVTNLAAQQISNAAAGSAVAAIGTTTTTAAAAATTRTMQSDEDFNIRFVNLVRQHRCLYDKKVPEYRNRDNQEKSWSLISQETRESVIHCKERWRNLRACLSRYIKQQSGNDPQHKPYYLTEHMAFLLPFLKSTRNSLDGNNSLAQLYQYSQQQQQLQNEHLSTTASLHLLTQSNLAHFGATAEQQQQQQHAQLEMKHSLSDNDDEETIDAFDPAVTASLQLQHLQRGQHSPPLSDTASANTLQNFIPDVQLSELQTSDADCAQAHHMPTYAGNEHQSSHIQHGVTIVRRGSHEFGQHQPVKRIKTECHASEATTTAQLAMYNCDNSDMEFFRSILPDIAALTPQQKRKFKIGILELIDDVIERFPAERTSHNNATTNSSASSHASKPRRNSSARDWRR